MLEITENTLKIIPNQVTELRVLQGNQRPGLWDSTVYFVWGCFDPVVIWLFFYLTTALFREGRLWGVLM